MKVSLNNVTITIPNQRLSRECVFQCEILVESYIIHRDQYRKQHHVIFVPLDGQLALVDVTSLQHKLVLISMHTCSPSAVFKKQLSPGFVYFVVCTNRTTKYVSVFELKLNVLSVQYSIHTTASNTLTVRGVVSNFLHVRLLHDEFIVFGVGTVLIFLQPSKKSSKSLEVSMPACNRIQYLAKLETKVLLVHCSKYNFLYDMVFDSRLEFIEFGIPYSCPQQFRDLRVFPFFIRFTNSDGGVEVVYTGKDPYTFIGGVCFGNTMSSYFAFSLRDRGSFVMDLGSADLIAILQ